MTRLARRNKTRRIKLLKKRQLWEGYRRYRVLNYWIELDQVILTGAMQRLRASADRLFMGICGVPNSAKSVVLEQANEPAK